MTISVKTYEQILGEMIRKLLPNTPLNDINEGSVLLTLLEAAATSDFENNSAVLNLLELLSIDAIRNNDLDAKGGDYGLSRLTAQKASGSVAITDSTITKRSTGLYALKLPPIAGSTAIFVNDAAAWNASGGSLYIGRGTQSFEGPITYTSIVNNGSFYTINLTSALKKDHLISDAVVDQQGKLDRRIQAGTVVMIPANNQNPDIKYTILRDAVIPGGENTITGVLIMAQNAGSLSNAGINTIVEFSATPFTGATVSNTSALTDGRDVETDVDYRERIKSYVNTLARGTRDSILSAIIGVSDADENKQVQSAIIKEPPKSGDPSIVYLDDGRGFQPSFTGQSVDTILTSASGTEEFLQLANYPIPRPQVINTVDGPYQLTNGMTFNVYVDGVEESVELVTTDFRNIAAATLAEIVIAINNDTNISFRARLTANSTRLLLYPSSAATETIQVVPIRSTDDPNYWVNNVLGFPTTVYSYIRLYRNNVLLKENETAATLVTVEFANWGVTNAWADETLAISVDGTPMQSQAFTVSDFGGQPLSVSSLADWVEVFNSKFAGITAVATSSGALQITSNKTGSLSSLEIVGGTLATSIFGARATYSAGQDADFQLNRQTGNIRMLSNISSGDSITAGAADTKGSAFSSITTTGTYPLSVDSNGRNAEAVIVADSTSVIPRGLDLAVGTRVIFSAPTSTTMRIMTNSLSAFASIQPGDYIYVANRGDGLTEDTQDGTGTWADLPNCGLFRVLTKGGHTNADLADVDCDSYVEVTNNNTSPNDEIANPYYLVQAGEDIQAFYGETYPQLWSGSAVPTPSAASISDIITHLNANLINTRASLFKTAYVKTTSTTEADGSIATPISIGNAQRIFETGGSAQLGNQSHIANRTFNQEAVSFFKRTIPTDQYVFLDRWVNTDLTDALSANTSPLAITEPYGELLVSDIVDTSLVQVDDQIAFHKGSNKGHYRAIKDIQSGNIAGTQHQLPSTLFDHSTADEITVMKSFSVHPDDNIVFIVDQDSINNTIVVPMSRTGRVHSIFPASNQGFSAYDQDNEAGITFDSLPIWGKTVTGTEFKDYGVWFRARNWYVSGGAGSGGASLLIRSKEYGPHGENIRFRMEYPTFPNATTIMTYNNSPVTTDVRFFFGSGAPKAISISSGLTIDVTAEGDSVYRYTFLGPIDLGSVVPGDIVGITNTSGITAHNRGAFRILDVGPDYIEVYNPNGAATGAGVKEKTQITCIADVVGTATVHQIITTADVAGSLDGDYFTLYDDVGKVAVWYDVDNNGTSAPSVSGAYRYIRIATIIAGDSASVVAAKTSIILNTDLKFAATQSGSEIIVTNKFTGSALSGSSGTTSFVVSRIVDGTPGTSLSGRFFTLYEEAGSVGVWLDATGSTPEPFHGCARAIRVSIAAGDIASVIATKVAVALVSDGGWTVGTPSSNIFIIEDLVASGRDNASPNTSGFTVGVVTGYAGADAAPELITLPTGFNIFPLSSNDVATIATTINTSPIITAVAVGDTALTITKATREERYTPAGTGDYSVSLAYNHNPVASSGFNEYISLFDSQSWVKTFQNTGPNFILKTPLLLQNASSAYEMGSAANNGTSDLGEFFKLMPITLQNVYHHFTHKALSQLPIIATVDIANAFRSIQLKSKQLGSAGAIEVVGGKANSAKFSVIGDAQSVTVSGHAYTEVKIPAAPSTFNVGDYVSIAGNSSIKRLSRLIEDDTIDVSKITNTAEYRYNPRISLTGSVSITITDVSSAHGRTGTGTVWRWTSTTGKFLGAAPGDLLVPHDMSWVATGNKITATSTFVGDEMIGGFPIIAVDTSNRAWVEVVNPVGAAMGSAIIGSGYVKVIPTPIIRWKLTHDETSHYRIEALGFNNLYRLRRISGPSPKFFACGVAVDDLMVIGGTTFNTNNAGKFRVLAVTDDHIVFQNSGGIEELNYIRPLNATGLQPQWTANSNTVAGAGMFGNVSVGDWVKKTDDDDSYYVQVLSKTSDALTLGANYQGTSGFALGVAYNTVTGVEAGVILQNPDDIMVFEGDSVQAGDKLFVDDIVDSDWFDIRNTGTFDIDQWGMTMDFRPFVRVTNSSVIAETGVSMAVNINAFYLLEGLDNTTTMIKEIRHMSIDEFDSSRRVLYLASPSMTYKMSQTNGTTVSALGKLSFDAGTVTGIDGYLYYTGLLRKVQRIIDGYEPDAVNYPGRRAVGGVIELLPPLIKRITLSLVIGTKEGVNLNEISNDILTVVVKYINTLGVSQDVVLSEIIVRVMAIKGVASVTFSYPDPSSAIIQVGDIEKPYIEPTDISIA